MNELETSVCQSPVAEFVKGERFGEPLTRRDKDFIALEKRPGTVRSLARSSAPFTRPKAAVASFGIFAAGSAGPQCRACMLRDGVFAFSPHWRCRCRPWMVRAALSVIENRGRRSQWPCPADRSRPAALVACSQPRWRSPACIFEVAGCRRGPIASNLRRAMVDLDYALVASTILRCSLPPIVRAFSLLA